MTLSQDEDPGCGEENSQRKLKPPTQWLRKIWCLQLTHFLKSKLCMSSLYSQLQGYCRYLQGKKVKVLVAQSCPALCHPMSCSLPGSSAHGILQARILQWVANSFSRESSQPKDRTRSPELQTDSLLSEPPGKPSLVKVLYNLSCFTQCAVTNTL